MLLVRLLAAPDPDPRESPGRVALPLLVAPIPAGVRHVVAERDAAVGPVGQPHVAQARERQIEEPFLPVDARLVDRVVAALERLEREPGRRHRLVVEVRDLGVRGRRRRAARRRRGGAAGWRGSGCLTRTAGTGLACPRFCTGR